MEKLEKSIPVLEDEIKCLNELNNMILVILGTRELAAFKREKTLQYYRMMYAVSE